MSVNIVSALNMLIKLGADIKTQLTSLDQATEDLQLLNTNLRLMLKLFEDPRSSDVIKNDLPGFVDILGVLKSIGESCAECTKALDTNLAAATTATEKSKKLVRKIWTFNRIPVLLADIQRKAEQLQRIYTAIHTILLQDISSQQGRGSGKEVKKSSLNDKESVIHDHLRNLNLSSDIASIDQMMGSLMKECKDLRNRLDDAALVPDTTVIKQFELQNPEGTAFWRQHYQKEKLQSSDLRYETVFVSWPRFIRGLETSFTLQRIPTGVSGTEDISVIRRRGSRYRIDENGTRSLPNIRPLWLPALRSALDPLHKGYVKPRDCFNLLQDSSFADTLRRLVLESAGYGTIIECERAGGDIALPADLESPSDHIGWISAQIVAVPTPEELGIVAERTVMESNGDAPFAYLKKITEDVHVYVRYLQTGQIERKSLSKQVRPAGSIAIGAALSIRYAEPGGHTWSSDFHITEFKAVHGGRYIITAGTGSSAIQFAMRPIKGSFDQVLRDDSDPSTSAVLELDCTLLGPSRVFAYPPKVGEKIQAEYEGLWYDMRVTAVDDGYVEYSDWDTSPALAPKSVAGSLYNSPVDKTDGETFFFPEEQLRQLGKGTRRLWQPWERNIRTSSVRPYRCFHIGDAVEAPVMYPDFRYHYHPPEKSQLFLPARIVDVQGDQYVVEFSPALKVHGWWPGRIPKGTKIDLIPGSGKKIANPFDSNRVAMSMDLVRPLPRGARPVLGVQSMKPSGWESFQGVHLSSLENLLEQSLWESDDSRRHMGDDVGFPEVADETAD